MILPGEELGLLAFPAVGWVGGGGWLGGGRNSLPTFPICLPTISLPHLFKTKQKHFGGISSWTQTPLGLEEGGHPFLLVAFLTPCPLDRLDCIPSSCSAGTVQLCLPHPLPLPPSCCPSLPHPSSPSPTDFLTPSPIPFSSPPLPHCLVPCLALTAQLSPSKSIL